MSSIQLKLTVDQIAAAIRMLTPRERRALKSKLRGDTPPADAFAFWDDPAEDIYEDLIPADRT